MRRPGFTLIEVIVVLGVLAALAGLALATLSGSRADRVMNEAVDRTAHGVASARARAMLEGTTLGLYARPRSDSHWMLAVAPVSAAAASESGAAPPKYRSVVIYPDGVTVQALGPPTDEVEATPTQGSDSDSPVALLLPDGRCLPRSELGLTHKDQTVRLRFRRLTPGVERLGSEP